MSVWYGGSYGEAFNPWAWELKQTQREDDTRRVDFVKPKRVRWQGVTRPGITAEKPDFEQRSQAFLDGIKELQKLHGVKLGSIANYTTGIVDVSNEELTRELPGEDA